jgi:chromosome segregation protein
MDWQIEQLTQLTQAIEESEQQIQLSLEEVSSLEQSEKEFGDDIERLSQELKNFPIDEMQERVTHWKTRIAVVEQALAESKVRLVEREKSSADALRKSELVNSNIQTLGVSHSQTINEINNLQEEIKEVAKLVEANRKQTSPLEENLENIEQKLTKMLSLESKERQVSSRAEQNFTQARIAQVRKQEALDALRRQIEADFGLVAFEYREGVSGPTPLPLEGFVENLPILEELSEETEKALNRQRSLLRRLGPVNQEAQIEFKEVDERYQFMTSQVEDLERAAEDVQRVIEELDEIMEREFCNTFEAVAEEFHQIFGRLFGGGSARLVLTDPDDLTDTGIDIEARLPGRREQGLSLLSGGERSLTAVALVFALLRVSPTPFCVLDEVDAMLDEANVGRFRELLRELSQTTQFILITHNRATVQVADVIYGITMGRDSTSQILSLKVDELEKVV